MKKLILISGLCFLAGFVSAQDIHFSQFHRGSLFLNPALSGVFPADFRWTAAYRSQWSSVPVPYNSVSGAFDTRLFPDKMGDDILGTGLLFNYDQAGDGNLSWLTMGTTLSYAHRFSKGLWISAGTLIEFRQRAFSPEGLTFDDQFNGDVFDPSIQSNEQFPNTNRKFLNLGTGINIHYQWKEKNKLDLGTSLSNLTRPDQSFFEDTSIPLFRKLNVHGLLEMMISDIYGFRSGFLFQDQGPYREIIYGGTAIYDLDDHQRREKALLLGVWHRWDDAIIAEAGMKWQQWEVAFTYDINISGFNVATSSRGGFEIGLIYMLTKVKAIDGFKACPIF